MSSILVYANNEEYPGIGISKEALRKARHNVDPDLLEEKELKDKLVTLRKLTGQTNGGLAIILGENKRTFESWVSGRYVPEGDKQVRVNKLLTAVGWMYIDAVQKDRAPGNAYSGFPVLFKLLDFSDAVSLLVFYFEELGKTVDYDTGNLHS